MAIKSPPENGSRSGGIAFDGGAGIDTVEFSVPMAAIPGRKQRWAMTMATIPSVSGPANLRLKALQQFSASMLCGQPQGRNPSQKEPRWNPTGYMRNVIETVRVTAA